MKIYIEKLIKNIDEKIECNKKTNERNSFLYNLGSVFTGVLGASLLFGFPWIGLSLIGGAASLQLSRVLHNKMAAATEKSYNDQKNHLNEISNKKLETNPELTRQRKGKIATLEQKTKKNQENLLSARGTHQIGNALVAGTIALAGFVPNPLVPLGTLACIGLKYLFDKKYNESQEEYETTMCELNNVVNDHNIGNKMLRENNNGSNNNGQTNQKTQTMGQTRTVTRRPATSTETVTPPKRQATSAETVTPPRRSATSTETVTPPRRQTTSVETVTPPRRPATSTETVTPPRRQATSVETVMPPRRPSRDVRQDEPIGLSAEDETVIEEYLRSLEDYDEPTNNDSKRRR